MIYITGGKNLLTLETIIIIRAWWVIRGEGLRSNMFYRPVDLTWCASYVFVSLCKCLYRWSGFAHHILVC